MREVAVLVCVLVLRECWLAPARSAPPPVEVQSVRVGLGAGNAFKIGCWTPVRVQLKAGPERFTGFLELIVPDDDGTPTSYRQPVDIPASESAVFTAYARPGGQDAEFTIGILDGRGRRLLELRAGEVHAVGSRGHPARRDGDPDHGAAHGC